MSLSLMPLHDSRYACASKPVDRDAMIDVVQALQANVGGHSFLIMSSAYDVWPTIDFALNFCPFLFLLSICESLLATSCTKQH